MDTLIAEAPLPAKHHMPMLPREGRIADQLSQVAAALRSVASDQPPFGRSERLRDWMIGASHRLAAFSEIVQTATGEAIALADERDRLQADVAELETENIRLAKRNVALWERRWLTFGAGVVIGAALMAGVAVLARWV